MPTPTTAELLNAIEVLNKLGEHINTSAAHSVLQMADTRLGEHYAGRIGVNAIEQTSRIKIVSEQLQNWREQTHSTTEAKCFSIRLIQKKPNPFASEGNGAIRAATPMRCQKQTISPHGCFVRCELHCQLKCHTIRCICRQPFCGRYAQFNMNKPAIPPDALNRFRHAASQYARTAKSRASRLLALKEDIAALRKRGVSYRAISELLTQSGITASDTCVMNFCHRILMERRHKPFVARRAKSDANHPAARKAAPNATGKAALPATPPPLSMRCRRQLKVRR